MDPFARIIQAAATLPEMQQWSRLSEILHRGKSPVWHIPVEVVQAMGLPAEAGLPASAAMACLQMSIVLVDDMLDNDERGGYREYGVGPTANYAVALQGCGAALIARAPISPARQAQAQALFAQIALTTAYGQKLDAENLRGEENYWHVVETKSLPYFAGCFHMGALFAGCDADLVAQFHRFGQLIGEISQIEDDIDDALAQEMNADWDEGRNNLLMMYAELADHPNKEEFQSLRCHIHDAGALERAQEILVGSGAVSYAAYLAVQRYQEAEELLKSMSLPRPELIAFRLHSYQKALREFLGLAEADLLAVSF